jgi:hypothetical protein
VRCGAVRGAFRLAVAISVRSFVPEPVSSQTRGSDQKNLWSAVAVRLVMRACVVGLVRAGEGMHARRRWTYVLMCRSDLKLTDGVSGGVMCPARTADRSMSGTTIRSRAYAHRNPFDSGARPLSRAPEDEGVQATSLGVPCTCAYIL